MTEVQGGRVGAIRVAMIGSRGIPATSGGVEQAVEELSAELAERGVDVTVYNRRGYVDGGRPLPAGVRARFSPFLKTKHLEAITHTAAALFDVIVRRKTDLVHIHATGPGLLAWLPRLFGVRTVVTVHGLDWQREKWGGLATWVLQVAAMVAGRGPNQTIVVSEALRQWYRDEHGVEVTRIPNGVRVPDTLSQRGVPVPSHAQFEAPVRPYVLFLGRLVPEKQTLTLVRAFRDVPGELELMVVGPSSHSDEYAEQVRVEAEKDPRVRMLGPQYGEEKEWLLQNAAVFVQPSSVEGLPIALLEAMSRGVPLVVSDIPAHREPITDSAGGVWACTVPVGDEAALAAAILGVVGGEPREISERTRVLRDEVKRRFAWPVVAEETEVVYRKALEGRRVARRRGRAERAREQ